MIQSDTVAKASPSNGQKEVFTFQNFQKQKLIHNKAEESIKSQLKQQQKHLSFHFVMFIVMKYSSVQT